MESTVSLKLVYLTRSDQDANNVRAGLNALSRNNGKFMDLLRNAIEASTKTETGTLQMRQATLTSISRETFVVVDAFDATAESDRLISTEEPLQKAE